MPYIDAIFVPQTIDLYGRPYNDDYFGFIMEPILAEEDDALLLSDAAGRGINEDGMVVGFDRFNAFYTDGLGRAHVIPELIQGHRGGTLYDVNDDGRAVGNAPGFTGTVPVRWDVETGGEDVGSMLDPKSGAGWSSLFLRDINNDGWIVGTGVKGGQEHAMLLRPLDEDGDGLAYSDEINVYGTDPRNA